jgi:hypothetical protein
MRLVGYLIIKKSIAYSVKVKINYLNCKGITTNTS